MISSSSIPKGQNWLIKRFKELGYPVESGLCHGLAITMIYAVLSNRAIDFNQRLHLIATLSPDIQLQELLSEIQKKYKEKKEPLSKQEELLLEVRPFFDTTILCHRPDFKQYENLFEQGKQPLRQDIKSTSHLTLPTLLQSKQISYYPLACGVYNHAYLSALFDTLKSASQDILEEGSIGFLSSNTYHVIAITLGEQGWLFGDANTLPMKHIPIFDTTRLANATMNALSNNAIIILNITLCINTSLLEKFLDTLKAYPLWNKLSVLNHSTINLTSKHNSSLIHLAVKNNLNYVVEDALKKGAITDITDSYGASPLHIAVFHNNITIVKTLLSKSNPDIQNPHDNSTPLHTAVEKGFIEIVKELLLAKANPNLVNVEYASPLHLAAESGNIEIFKELLNAGADPNLISGKGTTPLFIATWNSNIQIVNCLLLRKDLDIDKKISLSIEILKQITCNEAKNYLSKLIEDNPNQINISITVYDLAKLRNESEISYLLLQSSFSFSTLLFDRTSQHSKKISAKEAQESSPSKKLKIE